MFCSLLLCSCVVVHACFFFFFRRRREKGWRLVDGSSELSSPVPCETDPARGGAAPGGAAPVYRSALVLLATLFFMWGFITVINNTLLPHLRSVFDLNYTQTTLIESVWFIAYFVASIPSAKLIERIGYKN